MKTVSAVALLLGTLAMAGHAVTLDGPPVYLAQGQTLHCMVTYLGNRDHVVRVDIVNGTGIPTIVEGSDNGIGPNVVSIASRSSTVTSTVATWRCRFELPFSKRRYRASVGVSQGFTFVGGFPIP